ncbi:hypothetical protein ABES80_10240 [Bacillus gobiensis]|uniref:hypothetical protein n=1 Tax=Bacillus gobiensis TaxID=1441095 RepID=UPI003D19D045
MKEYIPAIITASVALIAAVGAQFLNNYFTHRRENKNYLKEVYDNIYSKNLVLIMQYFNVKFTYKGYHDRKDGIDVEEILQKVINNLEEKTEYLSPKNLFLLEKIKREEYMYDGFGNTLENKYMLISLLLDELVIYQKKRKLFETDHYKIIIRYVFLYKLLLLVYQNFTFDDISTFSIIKNWNNFSEVKMEYLYFCLLEKSSEDESKLLYKKNTKFIKWVLKELDHSNLILNLPEVNELLEI